MRHAIEKMQALPTVLAPIVSLRKEDLPDHDDPLAPPVAAPRGELIRPRETLVR